MPNTAIIQQMGHSNFSRLPVWLRVNRGWDIINRNSQNRCQQSAEVTQTHCR